MSKYKVIVGDKDIVYSGTDRARASREFGQRSRYPMFGVREDVVVLFENNKPIRKSIPMIEKQLREARRVGIPEPIVGVMAQGFELSQIQKDVVNRYGKVYVSAYRKDGIWVKPQLRDLPKVSSLKLEKVRAYKLGERAYKMGKSSVPAQDSELMELMRGKKLGEGTPILEQWIKAWHDANLRAEW